MLGEQLVDGLEHAGRLERLEYEITGAALSASNTIDCWPSAVTMATRACGSSAMEA
jgi:hypothetical protein